MMNEWKTKLADDSPDVIRVNTLKKALDCINGERVGSYGRPEDNFDRIASMWTAYLNRTVSGKDVAAMMIMVKLARISSGQYKDDNWVDIAGYAACGNASERIHDQTRQELADEEDYEP